MKTARFLALLLLLASPLWPGVACATQADVAVIVHPDNPVAALSEEEVSNLYLGRTRAFRSGERARVIEHERSSPLREIFFRQLNGMSLPQLNAYWARLQFTGKVIPPDPQNNDRDVLDIVSRSLDAIGYVKASSVTGNVRVVLLLKASP